MHQDALRAGPVAAHLAEECASFDAVERAGAPFGLHVWESEHVTVVLGRSAVRPDHVDDEACLRDGIPVIRRGSGGGTVVLAPGCLNYAVVLPLVSRPELMDVRRSFGVILTAIVAALAVPGVRMAGDSDLALGGRKVSGNAQRRGRRALLQHGTLLYAFDPRLSSRYLRAPRRQPAYRAGRADDAFLGNLPLSRGSLEDRLRRGLAAERWHVALAGPSSARHEVSQGPGR